MKQRTISLRIDPIQTRSRVAQFFDSTTMRAFRFDGDSGTSFDLTSRTTQPGLVPGALRPPGDRLPAPVPRREPGLLVPVRPPPLDPR